MQATPTAACPYTMSSINLSNSYYIPVCCLFLYMHCFHNGCLLGQYDMWLDFSIPCPNGKDFKQMFCQGFALCSNVLLLTGQPFYGLCRIGYGYSISNNYLYIVECQRGRVSNKMSVLQAATRQRWTRKTLSQKSGHP